MADLLAVWELSFNVCILGITMVEEAEAFLLYLFYMAAGRVTRPRQI